MKSSIKKNKKKSKKKNNRKHQKTNPNQAKISFQLLANQS